MAPLALVRSQHSAYKDWAQAHISFIHSQKQNYATQGRVWLRFFRFCCCTIGSYMLGHMKRCPTLRNSPPEPSPEAAWGSCCVRRPSTFCASGMTETMRARKWTSSLCYNHSEGGGGQEKVISHSSSCYQSVAMAASGVTRRGPRREQKETDFKLFPWAMRFATFRRKLPGSRPSIDVRRQWRARYDLSAAPSLPIQFACVFVPMRKKKMLCCFHRNLSDAPLVCDLIRRGGAGKERLSVKWTFVVETRTWKQQPWRSWLASGWGSACFLSHTEPFPVQGMLA